MKASLNWVRQYAPFEATPEDYQHKMIMAGTAVEGTEPLIDITGVVVGKVLTCVPHENSDHLHVCTVDVGQGEPLQIVCGAPNVAAGQLVPTAVVGAKLPGLTIKKGKIRGVESYGMLCSATELQIPQELYPSVGDAGLLILQEDYAPGTDFLKALGLDDTVVDYDILANRPDCLSIQGVARETAAVFDLPYQEPANEYPETEDSISEYAKVTV
ncbi:MAG: phenylalanine--tRNA ligase subunit beta, partial [Clostridiales bacterium]|nr:phenylalanine--tRNA ligase subunit beta [Clostridiales bacterium]